MTSAEWHQALCAHQGERDRLARELDAREAKLALPATTARVRANRAHVAAVAVLRVELDAADCRLAARRRILEAAGASPSVLADDTAATNLVAFLQFTAGRA